MIILNFTTDNIVTFITSIIGAFIGYVTCRLTINKPQRFKLLEKQLYNVYLPLFQKFEPNLFKTITFETAREYILNYVINFGFLKIHITLTN